MPWPDFTEFTFGYVFLREFEQNYVHGGCFPKAPDFISQWDEATEGYDVEIALSDATPVYLQLKRSYVLVQRNAKEIRNGPYSDPNVYRMYLHKNRHYRQHKALQKLEANGNAVFYVTSQVYSSEEFAGAYDTACIVSQASALFSRNEIVLPDETQIHHVSFKAADQFGYVYSREPERFERKFVHVDHWLPILRERRLSLDDNRELLAETIEFFTANLNSRDPLRKLIAEKPIEQQASILAYFLHDAQLTFVKQGTAKAVQASNLTS